MDKIYNANDYAQARGFDNLRSMLSSNSYSGYDTPFANVEPAGEPIIAFVSFGFWIGKCECNGAEYTAQGEPFYCMSCGNYANAGIPRPVVFPDNISEIETELLRRPILEGTGRNAFERAQRARAVVNSEHGYLSRTWLPSETIEDLRAQNKNLPRKRRK